jgi:hypothetical protein
MGRPTPKLPRQYQRLIEDLGISPEVRLTKDGHILLKISGRLCGKISVGKPEGLRGEKNIMAQIKRAATGVER